MRTKAKNKKIVLHRDTLLHLDSPQLRAVDGGILTLVDTTCNTVSCLPICSVKVTCLT
jgi:hypothetical protein